MKITAAKTLTLVLQNILDADIYKDVDPITKQNLLNLKKFGYIAGLAISRLLTAFRRAMVAPIIQNVKLHGKEPFEYFSKKKHENEKI